MARYKAIKPKDPQYELAKKRERIRKTVDGIYMFLMVLGVAVCGINQDNSVTCGWGLILMGVISIPVTAFHLWTDRKGWRPLLWYDDPDRKQYIDQETKEKDLATIRFFANFELIFFGLFSVGLPTVGILKLLGMI